MIKDAGPRPACACGSAARPALRTSAFGERTPDAYERLLLDVIRGNQTLFMRRDEVEAAWAWVDPILDGWDAADATPAPLSRRHLGAAAAIALIERDGRTWRRVDR